MNLVFVDTVGMLAVWNRADQWHDDAKRAYSFLSPGNTTLFSTTLVLAECANALARTSFREEVDNFRIRLQASGTLIWPTPEDWEAAWVAYCHGGANQAGLVDQVSFLVMRRLGITQSFTTDRHFQAAGFVTLF
jgi:predicted nucleic acid-binding protein